LRKRYAVILKAVASGLSLWKDIKAYVIGKTGQINDTRLNELLKRLIKYCYLAKNEGEYVILDLVIKCILHEVL